MSSHYSYKQMIAYFILANNNLKLSNNVKWYDYFAEIRSLINKIHQNNILEFIDTNEIKNIRNNVELKIDISTLYYYAAIIFKKISENFKSQNVDNKIIIEYTDYIVNNVKVDELQVKAIQIALDN